MNLSPEKKIAGVLAPLFALRSENDLGIGDIEALRQFIDWISRIGFKVVQLLPINEMGRDYSPYNAISAVAIDPTTLHLTPGSPIDLSEKDFTEVVTNCDLSKMRQGLVRHFRVRRLKMGLLERAFAHFCRQNRKDPGYSRDLDRFCETEGSWLADYSFFRALMEVNGDRERWDQWREEHRSPGLASAWYAQQPQMLQDRFAERRRFYSYVQWIAHSQWRAVKAYAEQRGVGLMGDVPFGISYCSADVYSHRDEFALDWSGGAPPERHFKEDEFTQKWGQNWGIPLYRWDVMRNRNLAWWRQRIRGVREIFHVFRIDHVLGFYRIYAFPWRPERNREFLPLSWDEMLDRTGGAFPQFYPRDDSTFESCEANRREGEDYLRVVLEESGTSRVAGEDLGTVPPYVRPSLRSLGVATFKIPQWENYEDGRSIPGSEYQRFSVATYATHDHKPLRALWQESLGNSTPEQARSDIMKIAEFAGVAPPHPGADFERDFYAPVLEGLFRSESWLAIVMITDLLARTDRFNVPGTAARTNWSRRLGKTTTVLAASRVMRRRMKIVSELLQKTGRIGSESRGKLS